MGCVLEFNNPPRKYQIICQDEKQKLLIDILRSHARLDLESIALLLSVSLDEIQGIYDNKFLKDNAAENLLYIFLFFIAD